jgi:pyridinium-3,5-biscarboxylic acid mononucleotide synthase
MDRTSLIGLLEALQAGELEPGEALARLEADGAAPGSGLDFAHLDVERLERTGLPEFVFGQGKSAEQITLLLQGLHDAGQVALATRVDDAKAAAIRAALPQVVDHRVARVMMIPARDGGPHPDVLGVVAVVCAGTSDLPVAEEAAVVLEALGHPVQRVRDVGVAGIHRLMGKLELLRSARAVIVVAGMEGALPSVVAGLVGRPVIAVPTSIGYGVAFGGVAAMLGMLNACAPGVSVVNIDNGFGAACQAALINRR